VVSAPVWVSVSVLVLLFIVFAAMMKAGLSMVMGRPIAHPGPLPKRLAIVPAALLILLASAGAAGCAFACLDCTLFNCIYDKYDIIHAQ
jgi:hypothetical protein